MIDDEYRATGGAPVLETSASGVGGGGATIPSWTVDQALRLVVDTADFAARKHVNQRRKDRESTPYINHPIRLTEVLVADGESDPVTLAAALLHDTVEDTNTTPEEIAEGFGDEVASLVAEMTDDKSLPKAVRKELQIKHAPFASPKAKRIKLADKICNLRDLADSPPPDWPASRLDEYFLWAQAVVAGLRGQNPGLEAAFDQAFTKREEVIRPATSSAS